MGTWVRTLAVASDAAVRCVCFPHAGGAAAFYSPLAKALAPAFAVQAVQYPGRQDRWREDFASSVESMADAVVAELATDLPLVLFGHSMGAAVAFEVALRLEARGVAPVALFASGRRGPATSRSWHGHDPDDATLLAEVRLLGGPDADLLTDPALRGVAMPPLRADFRVAGAYRYTGDRVLRCPIVALVGHADPVASLAQVREWGRHTAEELTLEVFPGGHFFLTDHLAEVAELVSAVVRTGPRATGRA